MRFLLLNQFGPASGAPTGRILAELGFELERQGHEVVLVSSDAEYGKPRRGAGRIFREGMSHLHLLARSFFRPKVDIVISLTSPACLVITAGIIAGLHRAKHFHWAMDLYPDVGVKLGELPDNAFVRLLSHLTRRAYQKATRVVALDEDMQDYFQAHYSVSSTVIGPPPPEVTWPTIEKNHKPNRQWLYSGNFGRAHEIQVLLEIQKILEDRQINARLILQGQGPQFLSSRDSATRMGLRQVEWRDPLPLEKLGESLLESDIVVVTRKTGVKGLLLPSKLVLAELSGKTLLWIGDTDGKTAQRLVRENRHGIFTSEDVTVIAQWLERFFELESPPQTREPTPTDLVRQQSMRQWETLLFPPTR